MNYLYAVRQCIQLGHTALLSVSIIYHNILHRHIFIKTMNRHFRLNFKALGQNGKGFHKEITERPKSRHHVFNVGMKQHVYAFSNDRVSKVMKGSLVFRKIGG